jgi:glycosyltransferase involved in cell wall biosynthesis
MVEGSLMGGYELGLESGTRLISGLAKRLFNSHSHYREKPVELMVVGRVAESVRTHWSGWLANQSKNFPISIEWTGLVPHQQIPEIVRSAHLVFSADLNAACPNSVIEAMACGTPVVAFDTGSLPELLAGGGGRIAVYGGNPWNLDPPDIPALIEAAHDVLVGIVDYRNSARARAVELFDVDVMVDRYLNFLLNR